MSNLKKLALISPALILAPALALASVTVGDKVGVSDEEIRAKLEAAGYTVNEIERGDGELEVEATINGQEVEIDISPDTGAIVKLELEDEDDDS